MGSKDADTGNGCIPMPKPSENSLSLPLHFINLKLFFCRCDSENCRALLQRYDAPPAIDAATEETTQLHVSIQQWYSNCFK